MSPQGWGQSRAFSPISAQGCEGSQQRLHIPRSCGTIRGTAQGRSQASPRRGSGCSGARCAIPTVAGRGAGFSQGSTQPPQRPSPGSMQFPQARETPSCRGLVATQEDTEHYLGRGLPPTSFVSFPLEKPVLRAYSQCFLSPLICLQKYAWRGSRDCLLAGDEGGNN